MMAQLELMKALFDRAGGAKHGSEIAPTTATRRKRSSANVSATPLLVVVVVVDCLSVSLQDSGYDSLNFKLTDCADAVTSLETIVSPSIQ